MMKCFKWLVIVVVVVYFNLFAVCINFVNIYTKNHLYEYMHVFSILYI